MTPAELAALPELPAPTFQVGKEAIDGQQVTPPEFVPWRLPEDPVGIVDKFGRAWDVCRIGDPPRRFKMRRPADDLPS
jgi:hypothetical protein